MENKSIILVLLYRFSESQESLLGYQLCWKLVKEGHHIYVTTTSTGGWLKAEIQKAEQLTEDSEGSITILTPQCRDYEQPSAEWIANFHKQYFGYLSEHKEIDIVIGTLPGTTITGIELKQTLNCKLILLATTKIGGGTGELTREVNSLVQAADEVWSVGSDIYTHYENIFRQQSVIPSDTHREILLQPTTNVTPFWKRQSLGRKIISVWNMPTYFFHNGRKMFSNGSNLQSFCTFSAALSQISIDANQSMDKCQWILHGLQFKDQIIQQIQGQTRSTAVKITPLSAVTSVDNLPLKHCRAFIVPDFVDESFNFLALSAIWLGIPTLVSNQSSIGKFLLRLDYSEKSRAVVNLMGHPDHDKQEWVKKINSEIFGHEANSLRWAKGLAEYLRGSKELWKLDLFRFDSCITSRRLSDSSLQSFVTAQEDPLLKVEKWQRFHFSSEPKKATQITAKNYPSTSQASSASNVTSCSSLSNPSADLTTADFRQCDAHRGRPLDLFCQHCRFFICQACHSWHKGHNVVGVQEEREKLMSFLRGWKSQSNEADRRHTEVCRCINLIVSSSDKAEKQMTERFHFLKGELAMVYTGEIEKLKGLKRNQLQKLENEASELEQISINSKVIQENGSRLLEQVATSNFISNASTFMFENEAAKLPEEHEAIIRRLQYMSPKVAPQNLRIYLKEYLLGLFVDPMFNEHGPRLQHGQFKGSMQSLVSVGGDSQTTAYTEQSAGSRLSLQEMENLSITEEQEEEFARSTLVSPNLTIEIMSKTSLKHFKGTNLKIFFSALFQGNSMWICGWSRNVLGNNDTVLLNVEVPGYNVVLKEKKRDPKAELPTIMFPHEDSILFAKRGGNEIFGFNTQTHKYKRMASFADLALAAMCGAGEEVYFLDSKSPEHIRILDSSLRFSGMIPTGLGKVKECSMDMCLVAGSFSFPSSAGSKDHTIILSVSVPHASVRAVNHYHGVLWQLDCRSRPDRLDLTFNPCSVSSTSSGDIYVADRGTDRVRIFNLFLFLLV